MKIVTKTKKQLIEEVIALHRLVAELEGLEAEHNRAEEVSPSEKERLLALMEALAKVGIGVDIVGIDYKVLFQNEALKRRFGDLTGKLCYEGYMGLKKPCDFCPMIKAIGSKKSEQVELTGVDGRDYELLANPLVNLDGTVDKVVEVVVDITEHRRIEEILKGSEEKLHLMFESLAEGITVTDLDANIVQVNEAVVHMHGYNNERELIGQSILKLITDKDHARAMENLKKILVEGRCNGRTEYRLTRRDGSEFPAELSASVFKDISGKPIGFITIATDITERKQAEETLRESEKRYHLLAENAADIIWTVDMNMQLTYISPSVARLLGYSVEEATAKKMEEVFTHASFEVAMKALAEELAIENMEQKELARSRTLELELNRKDSSTVPVEVKYSFLRAPDGRPVEILAIARDITERKRVEEQTKQLQKYLQLQVDRMPIGLIVWDTEFRVQSWNPAAERIFGFTAEEASRKHPHDLIVPKEAQPHVDNIWRRLLKGDTTAHSINENTTKDNRTIICEWSNTPLKNDDGTVVGVLSMVQDITERKRMEAALEQERRLFIGGPTVVFRWIATDGWPIDYVSPNVDGLLGYTSEELTNGRHLYADIIHPDDLPQVVKENKESEQQADCGQFACEYRILDKDGKIRWVHEHTLLIRDDTGQVKCHHGYVTDITERKRAEEALKRAAEEWRATFDSITDLVSIHSSDFRLVRANKAYADACKMKPKELIGKTCYELFHLTKEHIPDCPHKRTLETKKPAMAEIFEPRFGIYLEVTTAPIFNKKGEVVASVHVARDITERKRMDEALRESEEKYSTLVERGNDGIVITQDGLIRFANSKMVEIAGFRLEEVLDKPFIDFVSPEYKESLVKRYEKRISGQGVPNRYDGVILSKDGRRIHIEVNASRIEFRGRPADMAIVRDITERKRMDEQLVITDRLASVGELASGVAHELNNPLTSVIGFSQLLLDKDIPDDIKEDVNIIFNEARRSAAVVKNLLTFARKHAPVKQPVNINSIIEKVLELRAYEQKVSNIQVNTRFAPDLPEVMGDYFQLQQVFLNITINAEYFMIEAHNRGTLTITTEKVGDIVRASFADDGPGIAPENLGHLFDPFFTTKEVGKGTGLGLSICHGIITEHGGRIYAESELGRGATFIMELPISDR